ncbi:hypothetical protein [Kineococcus arenarius]|uniref:hypothetical protein n=1 Tax=Kineococcus sp. SYSU DK007 TaxID=3383128 RepID=UPI003D7EC53D
MSSPETGWHAFSPEDPDCPPRLRELANSPERPVLGTVTITIHDLAAGASTVKVGGSGASTTALIDAAITELHEARRLITD